MTAFEFLAFVSLLCFIFAGLALLGDWLDRREQRRIIRRRLRDFATRS